MQRHHVTLLHGRELGLPSGQLASDLRRGHAFSSPGPNEVRLELGHHPQRVEQQPADRVGRVIDRPAEIQSHTAARELRSNVSRVSQRAGESVELRHDEGVALAARCQRLPEARALPGGPGVTPVAVDALRRHPQRRQGVSLRGEVLGVGRDAGVTNEGRGGHASSLT